ncbi:MAG: DUF4199 domain-containing protein [Bacteroidia bacterium]|nr:DUF4199 domain-containing protein [Bacteroidia bacterium]
MKPTVKYGLISGMVAGLWMFLQYMTGVFRYPMGAMAGYLFYLVLFFCIFIGVKETRDNYYKGILDMRGTVVNGLQVAAISAVIHAVFTFLFWHWVPADFYSFLADAVKTRGESLQKPPEEIAQQIEQLKVNTQPFKQATLTIFNTMLPGIFCSVVFAFFLKKP